VLPRPRVAFVTVRCAHDIYGGAERLTLELAKRLSDRWDVEILTTCARDYRTWANAFPPGPSAIEGVPCRRFPVEHMRDVAAFDRLSKRLADRPRSASPAEQERWRSAQGPDVPELRAYLQANGGAYAAVYCLSYLYATTAAAIETVASKAILLPLAHDEWPLGFPFWDEVFPAPWRLVFLSEEERLLIERRFGTLENFGPTIGAGIAAPPVDPAAFRAAIGSDDPYALYLGRVEPAKGVDVLIDDFIELRRIEDVPRKLVLAGPVAMPLPSHPDIIALGPLDEATKWNALAGAQIALVPSAFESLSIAALEALAVGTPILVNGTSGVLVGHCRRSNAGLWYASRAEFIELMRTTLFGQAAALGENGRGYVRRNYAWNAVIEAHARLAAPLVAGTAAP
jgi:glycosyltransferase involved in cell wall biosynthesis